MTKYPEGETPEWEFLDVWARVEDHIDEWEGIYSKDDLIDYIDGIYPLSKDVSSKVYEMIARDSLQNKRGRIVDAGGSKIAENVRQLLRGLTIRDIEGDIPPDEFDELVEEAKKAIVAEDTGKFESKLGITVLEHAKSVIDGKAKIGDEYYPSDSVLNEKFPKERTKLYKQLKKLLEAGVTIPVRPDRVIEAGRIRRAVVSGEMEEALGEIQKKPVRGSELVKVQSGKYDVKDSTLRRDYRELRLQGFVERDKGKYKITAEGKKLLKDLRRVKKIGA